MERRRAGIEVALSVGTMLMFKRTQLYIALALAGLAELIVRAAVR